MVMLTRRSVLVGGAAGAAAGFMPLSEFLSRRAQAQTVVTRYDAASPEGIDNLKIYANAVAKMMDPAQFPEADPRSWNFQWYTHWTKGTEQNDVSKRLEIARIYGSGSSPNKDLAEAMWNTCQAHAPDNDEEENFLPWHRMYVLYLEEIIRAVAGSSEFTLPYWSYNDPNNRALPEQFRMPNDPVFGSLYRANRNTGVNDGLPIDQVSGAIEMNDDSLLQAEYLPGSIERGFNETLDFGLHGAVHVNVGTSSNMGFVPTAAGDPIFWLHHCEIDRFWASWNANGGANPPASWEDWGERSWTFVEGDGQPIIASISDFLNGTVPLGYDYATLIPVPSAANVAASGDTGTVLASVAPAGAHGVVGAMEHDMAQPAIRLGDGPVTAELAGSASLSDFHAALSRLTAEAPLGAATASVRRNLYLAIDNLTTDEQPGVGYNVYLELPANASASVAAGHYVGAINFFHAHPSHGHGGHSVGYVFNITQVAAGLALKGRLSRTPSVTIVPTGTPVADAEPAIGAFRLIEG